MVVDKIKLINFRNYSDLDLSLHPHYNIFIGNNGSGKTNVLEAIYFLSLTRSFRNVKDKQLINFAEKESKIKLNLNTGNILRIDLTPKTKIVYKNKTKIKKLSDYIGSLNTVLFAPESFNILKGSPTNRRNYLNIQISKINAKYLKDLTQYNRLLKLRNKYIKEHDIEKIDKIYFEILTKQLIDVACNIYIERTHYINRLNLYIDKYYKEFLPNDNLRIKYLSNLKEFNSSYITNYLLEKFRYNIKKEFNYGFTLYGPHRDEFLFVLNGKNINTYSSQGKQRISILALKLAELEIVKNIKKENPIVLLDDVFSELDRSKRKKVLQIIGKDIQVIMTTTELNSRSINSGKIYKIKAGKVVKIKEVN